MYLKKSATVLSLLSPFGTVLTGKRPPAQSPNCKLKQSSDPEISNHIEAKMH